MSKKKAEQREPSIRDSIGLTAASNGDAHGAHIFLRFVERELSSLGLFSGLPEPIALRCASLARDAEGVAQFIDGWKSRGNPKRKDVRT